jgi:hypothetical protein
MRPHSPANGHEQSTQLQSRTIMLGETSTNYASFPESEI